MTHEPARTLELLAYDPEWPARFDAEASRIRGVLGAHALSVQHIGSTSVPGLTAKPILDIGIAVRSEEDADACVPLLQSLGYEYRGPYGPDPRRRYYVRDDAGHRYAHIHLYILPASGWTEKIALRDALRSDPNLAAAYVAEKSRIAELVNWDKAAYSVEKDAFIQQVLARLRDA